MTLVCRRGGPFVTTSYQQPFHLPADVAYAFFLAYIVEEKSRPTIHRTRYVIYYPLAHAEFIFGMTGKYTPLLRLLLHIELFFQDIQSSKTFCHCLILFLKTLL